MKKFYAGLLFLSLVNYGNAQQDPQYNLYQFNQLIINPAYAGARDGISGVAARRQQWVGFDGAPQTTCLSVHAPVWNKNLGLGLTVLNDQMGPRNVTGAYANIAYILKITSGSKLSFGINAGYNRYQFNFSKLRFQTGEAPMELYQNNNMNVLDLNAGAFYRTKSFFAGLSTTHLNDPKVYTFQALNGDSSRVRYALNMHVFATVGKSFVLGEHVVFAPTVLVKQVKNVVSADLNLNFFLYKKLWLGAFYRSAYGPGALLQYYVTNQFKVGYSYDTGLQDARRLGGSHELMLGFDISGGKSNIINPRFL